MNDATHIIICGTTKAGTTSLFNYLADHPDVCPSRIKETGFFLGENYPNPPDTPYKYSMGIETYNKYFQDCLSKKYKLEATPGYLYSRAAPKRIKESLPDPKLIFILRDPIQRLISSYRFSKSMRTIPENLSFDEYLDIQYPKPLNNRIRSLETGLYSKYLEPYMDFFPKHSLKILLFEEFRQDTREVIQKVCEYIGISGAYFDQDYSFNAYNETLAVRSSVLHRFYLSIGKYLSHRRFLNQPLFGKGLKIIKQWVDPVYLRINKEDGQDFVDLDPKTYDYLSNYYRDDVLKLRTMINHDLPTWLKK